ncbi:hypothetical protein PMY12_14840 [Clostridium tertium]|uniref:hypothetical protein n=1 Tax=Clostridium tertium TaxID=1559 RepID=UPI00232F6AE5|nr:hypothetical protein [Clostridium tertium]MDB1931673.1 hypothetical protein [Clostridium tertium]MDB1938281.1 hypothetical protein [Clostridium tertium]MDI9216042.1 hypothetical protein [Clostridium tertium]
MANSTARELGARNLTAFNMQSGGTYGTAIPLENCVSINTTNNYKEIEYYSDCTTEYSSATLQNVDVEIDMSSAMALKLLAELTGQEYVNGKMATLVGGKVPQIALAYSIVMVDGTERRRVLYSLNLKKEEQNNETESEGEIWTFTGKAVPVKINGKEYVDLIMSESEIEAIEDEDEKASAKAEYESFFTKVVMPGASA